MNRKIKCSDFIQPEYDKIIELARFTEEQRKVFDLLNEDRKNDEGIMFTLHLSRKRYYAINTDYKNTLGKGNVDIYIRLAKDFLCDEDASVKYGEKLAVYYEDIVM